ncbi:MAG: IBR domain-containing protein [Saprospiraceae bacterium]
MDHKPMEKYKLKLKNLSLEPKPEFKRIKCPSCDSVIPADNLNINDKIAKCNSCDIVFPFHENISDLLSLTKPKQEVIRPEGIEIFEYQDELELTIHQPITLFDVIPLIIISFITFLLTIAFFTKGIPIYVPMISWTLAMFPIYNLFQRKHHKIYFNIDEEYLHIKWRPKKWTRDRKFHIKDIDQIYVKTIHGHNSLYMITNGPEGQKHTKLFTQIMSLSKARYLEQEIEKHLGVADREVPEETK